jgi:hypothetical protein
MEVSFPLGWLFKLLKPISDFFGKLFFYQAYKISTLHYWHRENVVERPDDLVEGIEYRIFWKPYYGKEMLITPAIWLRAKDYFAFSKVVLTVTAFNDKIGYQDLVTIHEINEIPKQTALPSIPFRKLRFEGSMVFTPYDRIRTKVQELYDSEGERVELYGCADKDVRPVDRLAVQMGEQKGDVEKWGKLFNLEFLEREIKEQRVRLIARPLVGHTLLDSLKLKLFSVRWIVKLIFWSKNIFFAKQLTAEFVKDIKIYQHWEKANGRTKTA